MALRIGLQALHGLLLLIDSVLVSFGDHRKLHMVKWWKIVFAYIGLNTFAPKYSCVGKMLFS